MQRLTLCVVFYKDQAAHVLAAELITDLFASVDSMLIQGQTVTIIGEADHDDLRDHMAEHPDTDTWSVTRHG